MFVLLFPACVLMNHVRFWGITCMIRWVNRRPIMPNLVSIFLFMGSTKVAIIGLEGVGDYSLKIISQYFKKTCNNKNCDAGKMFY